MRRLRRLFALVWIVPLVLCVAVCVLWAVSYRRSFTFRRHVDESDNVRLRYQSRGLRIDEGRLHLDDTDVSVARISVGTLDPTALNGVDFPGRWGPYDWGHYTFSSHPTLGWDEWTYSAHLDNRPRGLAWAGVETSRPLRFGDRQTKVPLLYIVALLAIPPTVRLALLLKRRRPLARHRANVCPACGYDLRATPGRCPECGAVPAT